MANAQQQSSLKHFLAELKQLKREQKWDAMITSVKASLQVFPNERKLLKALDYAQAHYVDEKLHSEVVRQLEEKKDYVSLHAVYQKLLTVFPNSPKLRRLLKKVEKKLKLAHGDQRTNYFTQAAQKIDALIKAQSWDQALLACQEILNYDPTQSPFKKRLSIITKKRDQALEQAMQAYFDKSIPLWSQQKAAQPERFISI